MFVKQFEHILKTKFFLRISSHVAFSEGPERIRR